MASQIQISRIQAGIFPWITKFQKRLPGSICKWLYRTVPKECREESLFERCVRFSKSISWPKQYSLDLRLKRNLAEIGMLQYGGREFISQSSISNTTVLPDGMIVQSSRIHPSSSLYSRLTPEMIMKAAYQYFSVQKRPAVPSATIIPRQLVDQGTYGDYVIEFLLPMVRSRGDITSQIILDTPYIEKYARRDLALLNIFDALAIPPGGIDVEELSIVPPCQPFDNFQKENLDALSESFPVEQESKVDSSRRIYLSRLGISNANAVKQTRSIENEEEIERYLRERGFDIFHPDGTDNQVVREAMVRADIVIFNHGSAAFHLIWGKPRMVIELASEIWWNPAFIRLAYGCGVESYHVLQSKDRKIDLGELEAVMEKMGMVALG